MLTESQKELVSDNIRLIYKFIGKYCKGYKGQHIREEIESAMHLAIVRAALVFDPSRGFRFSTLVYCCCLNALREWIGERSRKPRYTVNPEKLYADGRIPVIRLGGHFNDEILAWESAERNRIPVELKEVIPPLTDRENFVLSMRLNGETLQHIADILKVSKSYVGQTSDTIRRKAKIYYQTKVKAGAL